MIYLYLFGTCFHFIYVFMIIDNIKKQCIIVTKDFISDGEIRQDDINKLSCSVYRIKKAENFNASDLSTIRTKVTKIR